MKQFFLALAAISLMASCNSDNKNEVGNNLFGDEGGGKFKNGDNNNNNNNNNRGGAWSQQVRSSIFNACMQELGQAEQAKEKCECWTSKVEAKYPSLTNVNQIAEQVANQLAIECMQQFEGTDGGGGGEFDGFNEPGYDGRNQPYKPGGYDQPQPRGNNATPWAAAQRQQWMMGCTSSAQQSMGVSKQEATAYCECMTRKIEAKHSFAEAARMTVEDFSTPEWVNARTECQMNLGY